VRGLCNYNYIKCIYVPIPFGHNSRNMWALNGGGDGGGDDDDDEDDDDEDDDDEDDGGGG